MHFARAFANRDYSVALVRESGMTIHRSFVFPGYPRFPFMAPRDLQIGDTWTHPLHRGRGLAGEAIVAALQEHGQAQRRFWYVVSAENLPSIKVVEKIGFSMVGTAVRTKKYGVRFFGQFVFSPTAG
jgi:RimJ/RimL family protein N-acetyltransferase